MLAGRVDQKVKWGRKKYEVPNTASRAELRRVAHLSELWADAPRTHSALRPRLAEARFGRMALIAKAISVVLPETRMPEPLRRSANLLANSVSPSKSQKNLAIAIPLALVALGAVLIGLYFLRENTTWGHEIAGELAVGLVLALLAVVLVRHEQRKADDADRLIAAATRPSQSTLDAFESRFLTNHIVEQSLVGMAFYRGDTGECTIVNPAFCQIIGANAEQARGQCFRKIISWQKSGLLSAAELVLASGEPARTTIHVTTSFGREVHLDCLLSRVTLAASEHVLLAVQDVTDRVLAERRSREEAERTQRYLDTVQAVVVSLDREGNVTMLNRKGREVLGWLPEELIGRNWFEVCLPQPEGLEEVFPVFKRIIAGDSVPFESYDNPVVTRDGTVLMFEWRNGVVRDSKGDIIGTVSSGIDVTAKRAAEERNRRNHARLAMLLELQQEENASEAELLEKTVAASLELTASSVCCVMCRTQSTRDVEFAAVACHWGHQPSSRLIASLRDEPGPWQRVLESRTPLVCNDAREASQMERYLADGSLSVRRFLALPIVDQGNVVALVVVANKASDYDDTDAVQLELLMESVWRRLEHRRDEVKLDTTNHELQFALQQMHELARQADSANRAKSAFLANMSHEIRTPMNAVLGFTELLQRDENLTDEQRENLAIISRSGNALLELINDVLEVSKVESGQQTLRPKNVNLAKLGEELQHLLGAQARAKGIDFGVRVDESLPRVVSADEGKMRQILVNLAANAIKFTSHGSVSVVFARALDQLRISVTDTGVGIESQALDDIFLAFTQGEAGQASHQGTGLGLTLCRALAKLHGGDVAVESTLGQGSTFTVTLPLVEATAPPLIKADEPEPVPLIHPVLAPGQPSFSVLVADDDSFCRSLMERVLAPAGFELLWAEDGQAAVESYRRARPDFVLMDMRMPRLDGVDATRQIREMEGEKRATIVGISGDAFEEDRQKALECGCDEYIPKPFHLADLFSMFQRQRGVQFVESASPSSAPPPSSRGYPTSVRMLSQEWWSSLREATAMGDVAHIQQLTEEIGAQAPALASQLRVLVRRFDLRAIGELIGKGSGQWML